MMDLGIKAGDRGEVRMSKLTEFSMKNVAAIFIVMLLLVVGGTYSTTTLKVESMPDITFPVVIISTTYVATSEGCAG